jgi:hypothetical protein
MHSDGTFVGRSAPEIDIFEATIDGGIGGVSQSGQWGPFNAGYEWFNTTQNLIIPDPDITQLNSYAGGCVFCCANAKTGSGADGLGSFVQRFPTSHFCNLPNK